MTIFVDVLLAVLGVVFIAYPFFNKTQGSARSDEARFRELHSKRDTTYSMLKEIEFDFQTGVLNEEDYKDLEARYKRNAISILKDTDGLEAGHDIEEQVKKVRQTPDRKSQETSVKTETRKVSGAEKDIEDDILKLRKGGAQTRKQGGFCPQCGTKSDEADRFCATCGTKLK